MSESRRSSCRTSRSSRAHLSAVSAASALPSLPARQQWDQEKPPSLQVHAESLKLVKPSHAGIQGHPRSLSPVGITLERSHQHRLGNPSHVFWMTHSFEWALIFIVDKHRSCRRFAFFPSLLNQCHGNSCCFGGLSLYQALS